LVCPSSCGGIGDCDWDLDKPQCILSDITEKIEEKVENSTADSALGQSNNSTPVNEVDPPNKDDGKKETSFAPNLSFSLRVSLLTIFITCYNL